MLWKSTCLSLSFLLFLPLASAGGDTNILVNPGFEAGTEGWTDRVCSIAAVTSPVHSGSHSAKVSGRTATWQGIKQSVWGKMVEGKPYRISGWVRLANAPSATVTLSLEQQDDAGTTYHNIASATVTDTDWVQLSGDFTLHLNGTASVLDVYFEGPPPGVDFYVDDASVYGPEFIPSPLVPVKPRATGEIDPTTRHQKIEGFGASGAYYTMDLLRHEQKARLYDLLFKELGLDIFRIRNTYEIDPTFFRETVEIVKGAKAAMGSGLKIMLSSWSPPVALKSNNKTVGGTLAKRDDKYLYSEFAQWWYDSLRAYAAAGVSVDYITVQNELNYPATWDSCQFAPTETADPDLPGYNVAFEAVWQKLHAEMGPAMPKMLAPDTSSIGDAKAYITSLPDLSHVYGYAHHLYDCSGCGSTPDRYLSKMASFAKFASEHGNKPVFQTEYELEPQTWTGAMNTALLVHNSLTAENVAAYLYWDLFWGTGSGLVSLDSSSSFTIKPAYYAFKQYTAFIGSDWQRVEASTDSPGLRISAFVSPDDKRLTAVIINTTPDTDVTLTLSLKGRAAWKGEAYRSSQREECVRVPGYEGYGPLRLPARSITTLSLGRGGA
jgi:glucuronoarabinoxylan endo-1,4-beta-xylanase